MSIKILTILGTRPEIIRLSEIIKKLDSILGDNHVLVHFGQNFTDNMSQVFFDELGLRPPNFYFGVDTSSLGCQLADGFRGVEKVIKERRPNKCLVLGDTNTSLSAVLVERMGVPVYHMEAGNRCFDKEVPEEINRRIVDHAVSYNLPYIERSRENLLREGLLPQNIIKCGNPIFEVMHRVIGTADFMSRPKAPPGSILVTCHRTETVDNRDRFASVVSALNHLSERYNIIYPVHPKTRQRISEYGLTLRFEPLDPIGIFDFYSKLISVDMIITDSGIVQEEACIMHKPCVTIRKTTERPETVECGSNIVAGVNYDNILNAVNYFSSNINWVIPDGYEISNVSDVVSRILLGEHV